MVSLGGFFGWIILGGLAGWIASKIKSAETGLLTNIFAGIVGGLLGGFLMGLIFDVEQWGIFLSFLTAILGAVILIALVRGIKR
ncbi:GlsB/YeaQ/YmgE family stress response membrane protein [Corynebacterium yudongzhengii]|uniref:GlsB/YeaQ/YmgE family stress response membrane protein n=1 Tax=Corynebacterium yudongzhengii TaxID=2080740 RepID=A0A2U1T7Y5_9CORY|nr:GlsB/YeaQ/YmgE family stress response membrane protein [Corynebacterium yudongzhengii]AWB82816.1 GlsB/YeaQ/YmgE family stress response membrane protein [Corynebacterium yudongzhengii]PWC02124.1 GlsB/YeaQ/YmgE family stress response membrane protein [Corynebacterium yudongzhengii]